MEREIERYYEDAKETKTHIEKIEELDVPRKVTSFNPKVKRDIENFILNGF